jgi:hypothetical protein
MNIFGTLVVCVAFGTGAALAGTALGQTQTHEITTFERTCGYFEVRSERLSRSKDRAWLPPLAESCRTALENLRTDPGNMTDTTYLERLTELRSVVIDMNVSRFAKRNSARTRTTVTPSGEYLIAHYLGVMDAYHNWAYVNGVETAALPDGQ